MQHQSALKPKSENLSDPLDLNQVSFATPILRLVANHQEGSKPELQESNQPILKFPQPRTRQQFRFIPHRGINYRSFHEAACGELLEKYVKDFKVVLHQTYEVPVHGRRNDPTRYVDFYVKGMLVEYHPPRFWRSGSSYGDFKNGREFFEFRRKLRECETPEERREVREQTKQTLHLRYRKERLKAINSDPEWAGTRLEVATTAGDFYDKVICQVVKSPPPREIFLDEFYRIVRAVQRAVDGTDGPSGAMARRKKAA